MLATNLAISMEEEDYDKQYRLPGDVKPFEYHLSFEIHEGANSGSGDVEIKLQTVRDTHQIILHAHPTLQLMKYEIEVSF